MTFGLALHGLGPPNDCLGILNFISIGRLLASAKAFTPARSWGVVQTGFDNFSRAGGRYRLPQRFGFCDPQDC